MPIKNGEGVRFLLRKPDPVHAHRIEGALGDPATYQKDAATAEVERLYARWEALEGIKAGG